MMTLWPDHHTERHTKITSLNLKHILSSSPPGGKFPTYSFLARGGVYARPVNHRVSPSPTYLKSLYQLIRTNLETSRSGKNSTVNRPTTDNRPLGLICGCGPNQPGCSHRLIACRGGAKSPATGLYTRSKSPRRRESENWSAAKSEQQTAHHPQTG